MRFDMARGSRLGSTAHEALRSRRERLDGCADVGQHIANEQHQPRQQALHQACGIGPVALARARREIDLQACCGAHQRSNVVTQPQLQLGR